MNESISTALGFLLFPFTALIIWAMIEIGQIVDGPHFGMGVGLFLTIALMGGAGIGVFFIGGTLLGFKL